MTRRGRIVMVVAASLALAAFASAWPGPALAQCPLCRSALQSAGDSTARTMNLAIVVLLIPPVSIFCAIFAIAYRKGRSDDDEGRNGES